MATPDIQIWSPISLNSNGGMVRSLGGELTASYTLLQGLTLGYVAAYTQAEFTQLPADSDILMGYQLSAVPKWSMSFSADYDWVLRNAWHAHAGANLRYVGREWDLFVRSRSLDGYATTEFPSYSVLDLSGGVAMDRLTIKVFARNLFDTRGILGANPDDAYAGGPGQLETFIIQPRTIGVGFDYSF